MLSSAVWSHIKLGLVRVISTSQPRRVASDLIWLFSIQRVPQNLLHSGREPLPQQPFFFSPAPPLIPTGYIKSPNWFYLLWANFHTEKTTSQMRCFLSLFFFFFNRHYHYSSPLSRNTCHLQMQMCSRLLIAAMVRIKLFETKLQPSVWPALLQCGERMPATLAFRNEKKKPKKTPVSKHIYSVQFYCAWNYRFSFPTGKWDFAASYRVVSVQRINLIVISLPFFFCSPTANNISQ